MAVVLHAGVLDKRIDLLQEDTQQNKYGDAGKRTYGVRATVWASIRPTGGGESTEAGRTVGETTMTVEIRYRDDVSPSDVIRFGTRTFEIESVVNPEEANVSLVMECRETEGLVVV